MPDPRLEDVTFADPDDLRIARSEDDEIRPVVATSPNTGRKYLIRPITYGESLAYEDPFRPLVDYDPAEKAKLINDHLVEPDLGELSAESLKAEFDPQTVNDIVHCIGLFSGLMRTQGSKKKETETEADSDSSK